VFPTWLLLDCLAAFTLESPQTRIELYETVMDGALHLLRSGGANLAIAPHVPPGFEAEPLASFCAIPAAHPDHPLHRLGRSLTVRDLRKHTHLVVRDSGLRRDRNALTVNVERRWTVSNMATSIGAVSRGYGFGWFPEDKIRTELAEGVLKPLPLAGGQERKGYIYLIFRDRDGAGPGTQRLADILRERAAEACLRLNDATETRPAAERKPRRTRARGARQAR
jgi:DNA-binding transcriptional LysR family regulator